MSSKVVKQVASRRQHQSSTMSKKQLRQKVIGEINDQQKHNLSLGAGGISYQVSPKHGATSFEHIGVAPRSTQARTSGHFTQGRFIDT